MRASSSTDPALMRSSSAVNCCSVRVLTQGLEMTCAGKMNQRLTTKQAVHQISCSNGNVTSEGCS